MRARDRYVVLADVEYDIKQVETFMQTESDRYARKGLVKLLTILKSWRDILDD